MQALILSDSEFKTGQYDDLRTQLCTVLKQKGFDLEEISVGRGELAHCMGCFGCWVKTPGKCKMHDGIAHINQASMRSDAVFYLAPVVFGQFSANMTDVINRWLPNMLPFFMVRPDGSTMHPPRYKSYPAQVFVGYGETVTEEDAQLFEDINHKHRSNVLAFVYKPDTDIAHRLEGISLTRKEGLL